LLAQPQSGSPASPLSPSTEAVVPAQTVAKP
jgi:hypothetical protein